MLSGASESVAAAQRALAAIPTEYDDDGPVPPLPDMLQAIADAREVCRPCLQILGWQCHQIIEAHIIRKPGTHRRFGTGI